MKETNGPAGTIITCASVRGWFRNLERMHILGQDTRLFHRIHAGFSCTIFFLSERRRLSAISNKGACQYSALVLQWTTHRECLIRSPDRCEPSQRTDHRSDRSFVSLVMGEKRRGLCGRSVPLDRLAGWVLAVSGSLSWSDSTSIRRSAIRNQRPVWVMTEKPIDQIADESIRPIHLQIQQ